MKSISWYILCIAFVHMHVHPSDLFDYRLISLSDYTATRPSRTSVFSDYLFVENEKNMNLLIFKVDKPDYGPSWLTGATIGSVLGLMFAQYKYPVFGNFPHKMKRCALIGGALGVATCALINACLPKDEPLKVFVIDVNLSPDKTYYAVSGEYRNDLPYDDTTLGRFAGQWMVTFKGGPNILNNQFLMKKAVEGNYSGNIKKDPRVLQKILLSVM